METDSGATFVAGVSSGVVEPPLNDLWTIAGEEYLLAEFEAEDRRVSKTRDVMTHYHAVQIDDFLESFLEDRAPKVTGEDRRVVVEMAQAIYRSQKEGWPIQF